MPGFTHDMSIVSLGSGLVSVMTKGEVNALISEKDTIWLSEFESGYDIIVELTIYSDDPKVKDISIKCSLDQEFYLPDGSVELAENLQGKRLVSLGQAEVYCIKVTKDYRYHHLYSYRKSERTEIDWMYINGIKVKIGK
jgi:hypothetical protein